jgi:hypothetical protein
LKKGRVSFWAAWDETEILPRERRVNEERYWEDDLFELPVVRDAVVGTGCTDRVGRDV